jgi:hypothetical protein
MLPPSNAQGVQGPEYAALSRRGSVRSGASVVRLDTFCAPQTRVTAHLTPKIFDLHVKLRNHAAAVVDLDAGPNLSLSWQPLRAASKHFLVIDKPPSLPSIEPADNPESALSPHWLRRILPRQLAQGYLSITGRLDAGTHGLMVISRSPAYTGLFNKEIQARRVKKKYVAVVSGWNPVANPNHKVGAWTHYYIKRNSLDVGQHDIFLTLSPGQGSLVEYHTDFDRMRFIASRSLQHPYTVPVQLIVTKAIAANERSKALRCFHPAVTKRVRRPLQDRHQMRVR